MLNRSCENWIQKITMKLCVKIPSNSSAKIPLNPFAALRSQSFLNKLISAESLLCTCLIIFISNNLSYRERAEKSPFRLEVVVAHTIFFPLFCQTRKTFWAFVLSIEFIVHRLPWTSSKRRVERERVNILNFRSHRCWMLPSLSSSLAFSTLSPLSIYVVPIMLFRTKNMWKAPTFVHRSIMRKNQSPNGTVDKFNICSMSILLHSTWGRASVVFM